jgi:Fe-S oxidoreductase
VLDLCLECRACKSECPVNVDMARYKSEFLARYWQGHGVPLRARAFGAASALARWGSRLAPVSNLAASSRVGRWITESIVGIDRRRLPPAWTRASLRRRLRHHRSRVAQPRTILFADTFTNYSEPGIGVAAVDVLDHAGLGSALVPHGCCGRPLISQGLLAEARALAAAATAALYPAASEGRNIVFLEPSCLSAVREDAPDLLSGEARQRAKVVARQAVLFEEFLERECREGRATLRLREGPRAIQLHAHCHQRSMGLAAPAAALLSRIPGAVVTDLDAGCCGMAGSFGYAKDHYEVSRAIGERKLLPAARALGPGEVLVAAGTSCRHQVVHFTGVKAEHPAVVLRALLDGATTE